MDKFTERLRLFLKMVSDNIVECLVFIALVLLLFVSLMFLTGLSESEELSAFVDAVLKAAGIMVVASLLPKLGRLSKMGFGGTVLEFEELVAETNRKEAAIQQARAQSQAVSDKAPQGDVPSEGQPAEAAKRPETGRATLPDPTVLDDTQKGRFGGLSRDRGYELKASFLGVLAQGNYAKVLIRVLRDGGSVEGPVELFLDSTFKPNQVTLAPVKGVASIELVVAGGFTVGAWIKERDVLLELDLSMLPDAPPVVKYR